MMEDESGQEAAQDPFGKAKVVVGAIEGDLVVQVIPMSRIEYQISSLGSMGMRG